MSSVGISSGDPGNNALDVGVDDGNSNPKREAGNGASCVGADPRQCLQGLDVGGNNPAVAINDGLRCPMEVSRSPGKTEFSPLREDVSEGGAREVRWCGPPFAPGFPHGDDSCDGSLLQHEFTDQNLPRRGARVSPGEVSLVGDKPFP